MTILEELVALKDRAILEQQFEVAAYIRDTADRVKKLSCCGCGGPLGSNGGCESCMKGTT